MGGFKRHNSPTGVEPSSPKVGFAGVTGVSRPVNNEEHWILYNFEAHAAACKSCHDPLAVSRSGAQLCDEGHALAIEVAKFLIYRRKDDEIYSRNEKETRVEVPHGYEQTLLLLKAINRALRKGEKFPTRPHSHDANYYVASRVNTTGRDVPPPRNYDTVIREPKPRQHHRERESSDNLVADSKRGSLYGLDMGELERAEKRDRQLRYNVEVREPSFKHSPRRHHGVYS